MREGDEGRDASTLTTALHQSYAAHNSSLAGYGTSLEECFGEARQSSPKSSQLPANLLPLGLQGFSALGLLPDFRPVQIFLIRLQALSLWKNP